MKEAETGRDIETENKQNAVPSEVLQTVQEPAQRHGYDLVRQRGVPQ